MERQLAELHALEAALGDHAESQERRAHVLEESLFGTEDDINADGQGRDSGVEDRSLEQARALGKPIVPRLELANLPRASEPSVSGGSGGSTPVSAGLPSPASSPRSDGGERSDSQATEAGLGFDSSGELELPPVESWATEDITEWLSGIHKASMAERAGTMDDGDKEKLGKLEAILADAIKKGDFSTRSAAGQRFRMLTKGTDWQVYCPSCFHFGSLYVQCGARSPKT